MGTPKSPRFYAAVAVLALDSILVAVVIYRVPYTKIDWDAYMSQVTGFLDGERNYEALEGDTGPLVYPAGFLYIYSGIQYLTAGAVFPAQILFGLLYVINLGLVLWIYTRTEVVPIWGLMLLMLSKRIHSIFVLRLFNDCIATALTHASIVLFLKKRWYLGLTVFSIAVSVKMNVLLYAPPLLLLLLKSLSVGGVITAISCAAVVQLLLGLPFLLESPMAYISRSFNLGRVFIHFWSVNFKFVPEKYFVSKAFAVTLLTLHLVLLFVFTKYKWLKHEKAGGIKLLDKKGKPELASNHILTVLYTGNFIGIVCARSLHYQFYSWYFYTLPYLLWKTTYPTPMRLVLFAVIEVCWNIYPSNVWSSVSLLICHLVLLYGLWIAPTEYPYVKQVAKKSKVR
ncbi:hypothetical protein R1sor_025545 [Riccia sorocarpa]|uniref:dolichyl-P-Man:Man5GlcNAc2-PP-dolichol alpha-1,3-mannosyltransferase n=1 Tax=Riccia sorocarpa TaxID=122646 RepID=A0ABD3GAI0_9MARC